MAYPGDTLLAKIIVVSPQILAGKLEEGMKFEFREGLYTIGTGVVTYIVNDQLEKKTEQIPFQTESPTEDSTYFFDQKKGRKSE